MKYSFAFGPFGFGVDKTRIVKFDESYTPPVTTVFTEESSYEWGLYQAWLAEGNETEMPGVST